MMIRMVIMISVMMVMIIMTTVKKVMMVLVKTWPRCNQDA